MHNELKLRLFHVVDVLVNRWEEGKVLSTSELELLVLLLGPSQTQLVVEYLPVPIGECVEVVRGRLQQLHETEE